MASINHKIEVVNGNSTDTFHPETNSGQVYDFNNSAWLNSIIGTLSSLTTTQKTSLVASINEIAGTKANTTALTAHTSTIATTSQLGHVRPDGTTITIDSNGVISSVGGGGGTPEAHTHTIAQVVGLDTALNAKAPLASPTFTGAPVAPTATAGTNTTQIATTAFVTTAITNKTTITGNAGSATKLETARTINGVSFDGTANITITDSTKAPLASPTFTGTPIAPTATAGTNTTQIATTAFVTTAISNKTTITGNAGSATKLETARTINGVSFDGTANITIVDSTKAPLASPALTGIPTAPTASTATNSTQIATTAFVTTAIANKTTITGNAASATKLETARTINGVSFDGTANITISDSTKAPLASPALTGTPTAPTPATTTNTTQIATTAFVQSNLSTHLNDYMPHESSLSQIASSMDSNGIYTIVEFKRADNTLYMRSTATNPNSNGHYQTITWQFYASNGTTLSLTKTWTITYNSNGLAINKVVV